MSTHTHDRILVPLAARSPVLSAPPSLAAGLGEYLEGLRRRLPEATQLTLAWRGPQGGDPPWVRQQLLALLASWQRPPAWLQHTALAVDVQSTGTAADFCAALAAATMQASIGLVLDLPTRRLHCPDHSLDAYPQALRRMVQRLPAECRPTLTLATRWLRSRDDASWAIEQGLPVRLVPGAAADPQQPQQDVGASMRTLVRQLAGRVPHVTLVCPDPGATQDALGVLRRAGTPCDLELGHHWPQGALRQIARQAGIRPRVYAAWAAPGLREPLNTAPPH